MDQKDDGRIKAHPRVLAYRRAAELYCQEQGLDPNQTVPMDHPTVAGVKIQIPLWYINAERIFDTVVMIASVRRMQEEQKTKAANDERTFDAEPSPIIKP